MPRTKLKAAIVARLDAVAAPLKAADEAPQANRYVLRAASGKSVEILFEKGGTGNANLWVRSDFVTGIPEGRIAQRTYLAKHLNKLHNGKGKPMYGRHSGLRSMEQLGQADLTRFTLKSVPELDQIIANLQAV